MTAQQQQAKETRPETRELGEDLLKRILEEVGEAPRPRLIYEQVLGDPTRASELRDRLEASVRLTFPEDWVVYPTRDGKQLCYLQESGCERVRPLWGIRMRKVANADLETFGDGHIQYMTEIEATCDATGEETWEIGVRQSSDGLFAKAWNEAKDQPSIRAKLRADILKASYANGRGRVIRKLTGLASIPLEELARIGLDTKRVRGVRFEEGARGGGGADPATDGQIRRIAGLACHESKVKTWTGRQFNATLPLLAKAALTKKRASEIIDGLNNNDPITIEQFYKAIGLPDEPEKPEKAAAPELTYDPTKPCPDPKCGRAPELVADPKTGHHAQCRFRKGA